MGADGRVRLEAEEGNPAGHFAFEGQGATMRQKHLTGEKMRSGAALEKTRILVQAAAEACESKKGQDTRILELDAADSGLADFFLVTSASNDRQVIAIADEIEYRLKHDLGEMVHSVEGRRAGEWILLDYVDFVVHVFLAERRAFYDIERLRKSARPMTPAEFDAELKNALTKKTQAMRKKVKVKKVPVVKKTAVAIKPAAAKKAAVKKAAKKVVVKAAPAVKKAAGKKAAKATRIAKKSSAKIPAKKTAVKAPKAAAGKPRAAKPAAKKKSAGSKPAKKR